MDFQSRTYGRVSMKQIAGLIKEKILKDPHQEYVLAVGSDSQNTYDTKIVQVIVFHTVGTGGIYFYHVDRVRIIQSLQEKLLTETSKSLSVADELLKEIENLFYEENFNYNDYNLNLEFHCDVGCDGKSSSMLREVIGYVKGVLQESFKILIKPESYAASSVADRISKPSFCA